MALRPASTGEARLSDMLMSVLIEHFSAATAAL
jgi:hypothetical protein